MGMFFFPVLMKNNRSENKSKHIKSFVKRLLFSIFLLFCLYTAFVYGAFEERETSARVLGLSGVSAGFADDIDAVFYNPAGLVELDAIKFNSSDANLYDILNYRTFCLATTVPRLKKIGAFGFAYEEFDFENQYKETKFYFSHGFPVMDKLSIGYSVKSMKLSILYDEDKKKYTEKSLTSFDIAGFASLTEKISAGIVLSNINNPTIVEDEKVSATYKLGIGYRPSEHFNFGLDFEKGNLWRLGFELKPETIFVFRSGVNFNPLKISFGVGLNLWKFSFDYGISYHPQLEFQRLATLSFAHRFGPTEKPEIEKEKVEPEEIEPAEVEEEPKKPVEQLKVPPEVEPAEVEEEPEEPVEQLKAPPEVEPAEVEEKPEKPAEKPEPPVEVPPIETPPVQPTVPEVPKEKPTEKPVEQPKPPVNINTASADELKAIDLPPAVIKNIIRYRNRFGNFKNPEDLIKVPGVTKKIFESIKDRITVE